MALYQLKSSFAGGELSPSMYGRTDIAKYDSGAATLRNFLVLRYGGAANRPGFKFIAQTYNNKKAVLIPFMYSTDQNYIVEITAGRCQFYTDGGIVVNEDGTPYSIENFFTDIHKYLRFLEEAIILTLAEYGLHGTRSEGETGVWFDVGTPFARKICAMGVRASRWVTMHGFALNVNADLGYFDNIIPCGIKGKAVTSMHAELGKEINEQEVKEKILKHFQNLFEAQIG